MPLSDYAIKDLNTLSILPSNYEKLSPSEKEKTLHLQWLRLCRNAPSQSELNRYTFAYDELTVNSEDPLEKYAVLIEKINIPFGMFSMLQRAEIIRTFESLLVKFKELTQEEEKEAFISKYKDFLALGRSLRSSQSDFNYEMGQYLYRIKDEPFHCFMVAWRLQMIRLFAVENLDDLQYRKALTGGKLTLILDRSKLSAPPKILVAIINTLLLVGTFTLGYIINLSFLFRIAYLYLLRYPIVMLLCHLPKIIEILEMFACPYNQLIRPLCTYTQMASQVVIKLLAMSALIALYAVLYTPILAKLMSITPWVMLAATLYLLVKTVIDFSKTSFVSAGTYLLLVLSILSIKAVSGQLVSPWQTLTTPQKNLSILNLYSTACMLTTKNSSADLLMEIGLVPSTDEIFPEIPCKMGYSTKNLSHRFFNTPYEKYKINIEELKSCHIPQAA